MCRQQKPWKVAAALSMKHGSGQRAAPTPGMASQQSWKEALCWRRYTPRPSYVAIAPHMYSHQSQGSFLLLSAPRTELLFLQCQGSNADAQACTVLLQAAVSTTFVRGTLSAQRAGAMSSRGRSIDQEGGQSYSAAALSLVFHPFNPHVPTLRADVRRFEVHFRTGQNSLTS